MRKRTKRLSQKRWQRIKSNRLPVDRADIGCSELRAVQSEINLSSPDREAALAIAREALGTVDVLSDTLMTFTRGDKFTREQTNSNPVSRDTDCFAAESLLSERFRRLITRWRLPKTTGCYLPSKHRCVCR